MAALQKSLHIKCAVSIDFDCSSSMITAIPHALECTFWGNVICEIFFYICGTLDANVILFMGVDGLTSVKNLLYQNKLCCHAYSTPAMLGCLNALNALRLHH
jgi:hypothetical protein